MSFPIEHFPDAHFPDAHFPHALAAPRRDGGGGGKKRKPFKSWDQRQREREAELKAHRDAIAARQNRDKYGDLPPALEKELAGNPALGDAPHILASSTPQPLDPQAVREYEARMRPVPQNDDEEAFALILGLL